MIWEFVEEIDGDGDDFWYADFKLQGASVVSIEVSEGQGGWKWRVRFSEDADEKCTEGLAATREKAQQEGVRAAADLLVMLSVQMTREG